MTIVLTQLMQAMPEATFAPIEGSVMKHNKTCMHCEFGDEPVRMRRRWIHHFKDTGQIVVCTKRGFGE